MRKEDVAKQDGKAFGAHGITVTTEVLHPSYDTPIGTEPRTTETGLLVIVELRSTCDPNLPWFCGRWDERADSLDFDLHVGGKSESSKNFSGHHSERVPGGGRCFKVDIEWPAGKTIFRGVICFGLERGQSVEESVTATLSVTAEVVRKKQGQR